MWLLGGGLPPNRRSVVCRFPDDNDLSQLLRLPINERMCRVEEVSCLSCLWSLSGLSCLSCLVCPVLFCVKNEVQARLDRIGSFL